MAVGDGIQHWHRMLAVRTEIFRSHSPITVRSSPGRLYVRRPSDYRCICFPCHPYRTGSCNRPHDLMTYTFFFPSFYSATQFNEAKRWFESATVLCRFVPDGVAKAEKVRDGCLFSTPEHYHYFEGALHDLDPGGSLVKGSPERIQLYVWFRYHSTSLSTPPPRSFCISPHFLLPGSTDGCGF